MSPEELLKPRYKVIADYPHCGVPIGFIYENVNEGAEWFDKWPHLFKKLEWWQERKESDMPEYVKYNDNSLFYPVERICKGNKAPFTAAGFTASDFVPATKEEYENQNK